MRKRPLYRRSRMNESARRPVARPMRRLHESAEEKPYTESETEDFIKKYTKNFTLEDGTIRTYFKEEKDDARKILRDHYKIVEVSDGRRSNDEDMCWVLAFNEPKTLKEAVDWSHDTDWSGSSDPEELSDEDELLFNDAWTQVYDMLVGTHNKYGTGIKAKTRFNPEYVKNSPYHSYAVLIETSRPEVKLTPPRDEFINDLVNRYNAVRRTLKNGDTEIILPEAVNESFSPRKKHMIESARRRFIESRRRRLKEGRVTGLNPTRQKSYYGKANIVEDDNGKAYLQSYDTVVCSVDPNSGKFTRLWDGSSATTMKHINDFRRLYNLAPISVGEWRKLPVGRR